MVGSKPIEIQDSLPRVSWREVAKINTQGFSPLDIQKIEQAFEEIEKTKSGQTFFRAMQAKQADSGSGKVQIAFSSQMSGQYSIKDGINTVVLNLSKLDEIMFHTPHLKVKPMLSEIIFHELGHYLDGDFEKTLLASDALQRHNNQHGPLLLSSKKEESLIIPNAAFLQGLPEPQREALIALRQASYNQKISPEDFEILFAEKMPILQQNPVINEVYQDFMVFIDGTKPESIGKAEHFTMVFSNIFLGDLGIEENAWRTSYEAKSISTDNRDIPQGTKLLFPIDDVERKDAQKQADEWTKNFGDLTKRKQRIELKELYIPNSVREAMKQNGVIMDIPAQPSADTRVSFGAINPDSLQGISTTKDKVDAVAPPASVPTLLSANQLYRS